MVKPAAVNKQPLPQTATDRSSVSVNGSVGSVEHTYCVVLHVVEAINFYGREMREGEREQIVMNAALNTVDFEVEGTPSVTAETIIFNSNCIWECDMAGIKRIKTDHRPVKMTFFACSSNGDRKTIGSLLLPLRGLPVLGSGGNNNALQLKMFWHKLICISNEFRSHKPEVLLLLAIIKKSLLHTKDFQYLMAFNSTEKQSRTPPLQSPGHSITANMLQSQANVYVQSLVQLGLLQVGNDPLVDCDIIEVVLQFKQLKNVNKFVKSLFHGKDVDTVLLMFDFVGNVTNIELKLNNTDCYTLNDVLGLRFKSSMRSIRLYFQRIFYLPINMYVNGTSIANYRMDFGKLLPVDGFFADSRKYVRSGCFAFERFGRSGSARELKPIMDYTFTVDIQEVYWRQQEKELKEQAAQPQEPLDMNSLSCSSAAVIHEVPKERAHEQPLEWQHNVEEQCAADVASARSLNVGAELSASDERDTASESPQSDAPKFDVSTAGRKSQGRRKKFLRLLVNNSGCDDEEDHNYVNSIHQVHAEDFDMQQQQIEADIEIDALYKNRKFRRPISNVCEANMIPQTEDCLPDRVKHKSNSSRASNNSENTQNRSHKSIVAPRAAKETYPKHVQKGMQAAEYRNESRKVSLVKGSKSTRVDNVEYELESIAANTPLEQEVPKELRNRRLNKSKPNAELLPDPDEIRNVQKQLSAEDSSLVKPKIMRIKKCVSKSEEFGLSHKSLNISNKYLDEVEYISERQQPAGREELGKQLRKRIVEHSMALETTATTMDTEELSVRGYKPETPKSRAKLADAEASESILRKRQPKVKRTVVSKTDLSLSARWVEVSKEQSRALEETERFIDMTCMKNFDEVSENTDANFSLEPSNEEDFQQSKVQRTPLKKSSLSDVRRAPTKSKQLRPKAETAKHLDNVPSSELEYAPQPEVNVRKVRRVVKKQSLEKYLDEQDVLLREAMSSLSQKNELHKRQRSVKVVASTPSETETNDQDNVSHRSAKKKSTKLPETETKGAACCAAKKKNSAAKSQLDADAQVSRMEVTVHMYDQPKTVAAEAANQSVLTDAGNLDESLKKILSAGRQLQEEMQRKALDYMNNLEQHRTIQNSTMDADYEFKFNELEQHIHALEEHLQQFEQRTQEMQAENARLSQEKMQLKERINHMERQIGQLCNQEVSGNQLQQVLTEMRTQNERLLDMSKAKDRYKKQWRRCARRVHHLKLAMYEKSVQQEYHSMKSNVLNLKSILTQDADEFEREYGRFRKADGSVAGLNFVTGSGEPTDSLLKDCLRGLTSQTLSQHSPDSTRMH